MNNAAFIRLISLVAGRMHCQVDSVDGRVINVSCTGGGRQEDIKEENEKDIYEAN